MIEAATMINDAVKEKEGGHGMSKKGVLIVAGLLFALSFLFFSLSPGALKNAVNEATTDVIIKELKPINKKLDENCERLEKLEEIQSSQVVNNGIAAYKKFENVPIEELPSKLESSTQNSSAIMIALRVDNAKDILFQIDPVRTKYYQDYFDIE